MREMRIKKRRTTTMTTMTTMTMTAIVTTVDTTIARVRVTMSTIIREAKALEKKAEENMMSMKKARAERR